jgi:formate hydrogenlyase subunit 4
MSDVFITAGKWLTFALFVFLLPPLVVGVLRKCKARLQNRIGAPICQPFYDLSKFWRKGETVSQTTSWIFRGTAVINCSVMLVIAMLVPWLSFKPYFPNADLILVIYLFALTRFFSVLAALDAGSTFGGFGASREVTLAMLVEPAIMLCLASLGCVYSTTDLNIIFTYDRVGTATQSALWLLAGTGLFLSSLVELSRMPVDDPTTHLELTMIHEAMILENSGPNLALTEFTHYLKMAVMWGLCAQCFLHAVSYFFTGSDFVRSLGSLVGLVIVLFVVALIEGTAVKLQWKKVPEFIAFAIAMSLLCVFVVIAKN